MEQAEERSTNPLWLLALLSVMLINGWVLARWVKKDTRTLGWDEAIHMTVAFDFQERLASQGWASLLKPAHFNYPPLYHIQLSWAVNRVKDAADSGALVNFFYLCALIAGVFLIGRRMMGSLPGFTAATLISCYPIMADMARPPMIDLALTAWVCWAMYGLLKSEHFERPGWSVVYGIILALGMLTKWSAVLYLLGPLGFSAYQAVRARRWRWILMAHAVAAALCFPWYAYNLIPVLSRIFHVSALPSAAGVTYGKGLDWLWYLLSMPEQLNLAFFILFLPGLAVVFWKPKALPVWLWLVGGLIVFTLVQNHNIRYSMPVLPAAALLSVAWLPESKRFPFIGVLALSAVFFLHLHFWPGRLETLTAGPVRIPIVDNYPPVTGDWKHDAIIRRVQELIANRGGYSRVITLSNNAQFHSTTLNVSRQRMGAQNFCFKGTAKNRWTEFGEFILYKTGDIGPEFTIGTIKRSIEAMQSWPWFKEAYKEAGRWALPDGSEAILYRFDPKPDKRLNLDILNSAIGALQLPRVEAEGVTIKAEPLSALDSANGRLKELRLQGKKVAYRGITFEDVSIRLIEPRLNIPLLEEGGQIELINLNRLKLEASISSESILSYLSKKAKKLKNPQVSFTGSRVLISGQFHGFPVMAEADLRIENGFLKTRLERVTIARVPFPSIFIRGITDRAVSLSPNCDLPFYLDIGSIRGEGAYLKISG